MPFLVPFSMHSQPESGRLLQGRPGRRVTVLRGNALGEGQPVALTAVPYYAWCNREKGRMNVWIDENPATGK